MTLAKRYLIIGNWSYAGTSKFRSHALQVEEKLTVCGLDVSDLMNRKNQQWEQDESTDIGCLKCLRNIEKAIYA